MNCALILDTDFSDAKERAATGSRVLAEDSSDEEASHKKRTVIDDVRIPND
ncbi:hypothetical protein Tcan_11297 [Toxocara canis]|uniref:Uncharacterized protein n=1 Tax=Toxocara canis TaxID=6265 RepID=A0A0B2W687_TOXCA|nr:hypothetical protein Tcan_11297 [Toxocara canis]